MAVTDPALDETTGVDAASLGKTLENQRTRLTTLERERDHLREQRSKAGARLRELRDEINQTGRAVTHIDRILHPRQRSRPS